MPNHHHRAGSLRQTNKRNKRSKASKRSVSRSTGGRVNVKRSAGSAASSQSKADRRNYLQQKRNASQLATLQKKRGIISGVVSIAPRVIGILSLGESADSEEQLKSQLMTKASQTHENSSGGATAKYDTHKKDGNLTFLTCSKAFGSHYDGDNDDVAVMAALDLCRVCDVILFVIDGDGPIASEEDLLGMSIGGKESTTTTTKSASSRDWDHLISDRGDRILTAVKGQGLPTPLTILTRAIKDEPDQDIMTMQSAKSIRRSSLKKHADLKRYVSRFATSEFGVENNKVIQVDLTTASDNGEMMEDNGDDDLEVRQKQASVDVLIRTLCTMAATPPKWVAESPRAYLVADSHSYHADKEELILTGYVRGMVPFNVTSLIHVPNVGTFACKSVQKATPPMLAERRKGATGEMEDDAILFSDPTKRESLEMFATPDALDGEQNLVGFDDDMHDGGEYTSYSEDNAEPVERPAGWSDYQSAWLDAVDDIGYDSNDLDHGELAKELNQKTFRSRTSSVATDAMDVEEDYQVSAVEKKALLLQRVKNQQDDMEFPDEVEVDEDVNARDRFARYRSLQSFRKSHWDPKENLPDSYGSIYHFSSFKVTQRDVFAEQKEVAAAANAAGDFWGGTRATGDQQNMGDESEEEDLLEGCVPSGSFVTITLEGVTSMTILAQSSIVAVSLLPHENKASVLHIGLCQSSKCDKSDDNPVKSKDVLTFRCGWRTWKARAVFSQNNLNSDKHKFERFLPQGGAFFAASVFGPVTYTPCPVLVFRDSAGTNGPLSRDLVAIGSVLGADADRIVVKRIVLTGYPVRVHKRHATVKYMFYNPDDVRWFKPAGLSTKHGLHGHIIQSVGEHGTVKCLFNAPIKQHDTVCLPLYKRIFPKFAPAEEEAAAQNDGVTVPIQSSAKKTDLVIR